MTYLRLLVMLITLAAISQSANVVMASHLRDGARTLEESPPTATMGNVDTQDSSTVSSIATQDSSTVGSIATQSSFTKQTISGVYSGESAADDSSAVEHGTGSATGDIDGVRAWAQCGGLYYRGETTCAQHSFCKKLSEFISVCFPEARPTEQVVRLEL